ncbi:MAG: hypothetical protein H8E98_04025 [Bacteroidetes bacterium]|nr:hypothetical protein [Bacteroidota bacterium]
MIVDNLDDFNVFLDDASKKNVLLIPVYSDTAKHSINNRISLLYIQVIGGNTYIIPSNHSESLINKDLINQIKLDGVVFVLNKKKFMYHMNFESMFDYNTLDYFYTNTPIDVEAYKNNCILHYTRRYGNIENIIDIIPLIKLVEMCNKIRDDFITFYKSTKITDQFAYYDLAFNDTLFNIEKNGLKVTEDFHHSFNYNQPAKDMVYSEYNIFTRAGRVSNAFGGVNFSAINNNTDRECFISRFGKDGMIIQFDYTAYHLYLVAELVGYKFPKDISAHEYLGRYYYDKKTLTEDEIAEAKKINFNIIYGGIDKDFLSIPFFDLTNSYIEEQWKSFENDTYICSPVFKRKIKKSSIDDMSPNKLFNYLIQSMESETSIMNINKVVKLLDSFKSKIILYTYDSILVDFNKKDGGDLITNIKDILECGDKYPISVKIGYDYFNMINVDKL